MTKAVTALKAKLAANPLFFPPNDYKCVCLACLGGVQPKGYKRVAVYQATNYSFHTCTKCNTRYYR